MFTPGIATTSAATKTSGLKSNNHRKKKVTLQSPALCSDAVRCVILAATDPYVLPIGPRQSEAGVNIQRGYSSVYSSNSFDLVANNQGVRSAAGRAALSPGPPCCWRVPRADGTEVPYRPSSFDYSPAGYSARKPDWERPF